MIKEESLNKLLNNIEKILGQDNMSIYIILIFLKVKYQQMMFIKPNKIILELNLNLIYLIT